MLCCFFVHFSVRPPAVPPRRRIRRILRIYSLAAWLFSADHFPPSSLRSILVVEAFSFTFLLFLAACLSFFLSLSPLSRICILLRLPILRCIHMLAWHWDLNTELGEGELLPTFKWNMLFSSRAQCFRFGMYDFSSPVQSRLFYYYKCIRDSRACFQCVSSVAPLIGSLSIELRETNSIPADLLSDRCPLRRLYCPLLSRMNTFLFPF